MLKRRIATRKRATPGYKGRTGRKITYFICDNALEVQNRPDCVLGEETTRRSFGDGGSRSRKDAYSALCLPSILAMRSE